MYPMAPNLAQSQHAQIQHMIEDGSFTYREIGKATNCSFDAIKAISRNLRDFGSTRAPRNRGGRPPSITADMRDALLEHLLRKPGLTLEEMVIYLWDEFESLTTTSSVSRTLHSMGWSKKKARGIAKGRSEDLRDFYLHSISHLQGQNHNNWQ